MIADFGKKPLRFNHTAHESPLFTDEALAELIERTPRENYYVNTMEPKPEGGFKRREGEIRDLSGAEALEAVRTGQIWILLLFPDESIGGYRDLLETAYGDITTHVPDMKIYRKKISILISSPNIPVLYHCDLAGQTLWQVRGEKTVYVYPNREPYLPQPNLEKIILGEAHEISLPYDPAWDEDAQVFTIQPGDMLHWELNAPHRIQNGDCVNVSFTTEHVTPEVRRNFVMNYGNGVLRRLTGARSLSREPRGLRYASRFATMAAARAFKLQKGRGQKFHVDFTVDPSAPRGYRDIPAYDFQK